MQTDVHTCMHLHLYFHEEKKRILHKYKAIALEEEVQLSVKKLCGKEKKK